MTVIIRQVRFLNNDFTEEESFETALDVEHAIVLGFADDNF